MDLFCHRAREDLTDPAMEKAKAMLEQRVEFTHTHAWVHDTQNIVDTSTVRHSFLPFIPYHSSHNTRECHVLVNILSQIYIHNLAASVEKTST